MVYLGKNVLVIFNIVKVNKNCDCQMTKKKKKPTLQKSHYTAHSICGHSIVTHTKLLFGFRILHTLNIVHSHMCNGLKKMYGAFYILIQFSVTACKLVTNTFIRMF